MKVLSLYIQGGEHRVNECLNARQRKHTKPNLQQQKRGTSLSLQYHLIPKRARLCTFSKWQCKEKFPGQHACELTLFSLLPWHHVKQEIFHFHKVCLGNQPTSKASCSSPVQSADLCLWQLGIAAQQSTFLQTSALFT